MFEHSDFNTVVKAVKCLGHLFFLFSYGRSYAPSRTHTFAFFAKLDPAEPSRIEDHIPISWLPVITKPRQDPNGIPNLEEDGTFQIAPIAAGSTTHERLGWNFSTSKTITFRRRMNGTNRITFHGAYEVNHQQYVYAKMARSELDKNVELVMDSRPRNMAGYYYKAINQSLFVCPNGGISGIINCFQAVLASFGVCETSGPLSGVTVTDYLLTRLKDRNLLGKKVIENEEDAEPYVTQVIEREESGEWDKPR